MVDSALDLTLDCIDHPSFGARASELLRGLFSPADPRPWERNGITEQDWLESWSVR